MKNRTKAYLSLLVNVAIWGAALPIVKPALNFISPNQYLLYRYLIAAPLSLPVLIYLVQKYRPSCKTIISIFLLESISVIGYLSILYAGLKLTTSLEATLIANTASIFVIIGGIAFLKEKEEKHELFGLAVAITGALLLTFEPIHSQSARLNLSSLSGNLLIVLSNIFWAAYLLLAKRFYKSTPKLLIGVLSPWVGLCGFLGLVLLTNPTLSLASLPETAAQHLAIFPVLRAVVYMSVLGSLVAVPAYIYGNNLIEASEAALFSYLQPLIAIPLATIWLKEPLNWLMVFAIILSSLGVYIAEKRKTGIKRKVSCLS